MNININNNTFKVHVRPFRSPRETSNLANCWRKHHWLHHVWRSSHRRKVRLPPWWKFSRWDRAARSSIFLPRSRGSHFFSPREFRRATEAGSMKSLQIIGSENIGKAFSDISCKKFSGKNSFLLFNLIMYSANSVRKPFELGCDVISVFDVKYNYTTISATVSIWKMTMTKIFNGESGLILNIKKCGRWPH